jgi:ribosomal protein L7/L12
MVTASAEPIVSEEAIAALKRGNAIEAIKLVRSATGLGLKESKDVVDGYLKSHPELRQAMAEQSSEAGRRFGLVVALLLGAALIAWVMLRKG